MSLWGHLNTVHRLMGKYREWSMAIAYLGKFIRYQFPAPSSNQLLHRYLYLPSHRQWYQETTKFRSRGFDYFLRLTPTIEPTWYTMASFHQAGAITQEFGECKGYGQKAENLNSHHSNSMLTHPKVFRFSHIIYYFSVPREDWIHDLEPCVTMPLKI